MKPYYSVVKSSELPPWERHLTLKYARLESLRLATLHPGQSFEILMCIGITRPSEPSTLWMDGLEP